ncbi:MULTISPECIES: hypothetical protein [unclassified Cedecea]|uniref:hypothetical protein n=1 Tax=unclassified Cedecea TaxID=2649846 RepID=UPI00301889C9
MIARYVPGAYGGQMLKHEDGTYVRQEDYTELQRQLTAYEATVTNLTAQVQGLAAENADLKHPGTYLPSKRETPITDAVLAEILAQGVDLAIEHLTKKFEGTGGVGVPVMALEHLASELRKEQGK